MVTVLPAIVPSWQQRGPVAGDDRHAAQTRAGARRQSGGGGCVGDRHHPGRPLGGNRRAHHRGVHVYAVADDFRGDFLRLQHGPGKPGCSVRHGRHAIEQVRGLPGTGGDRSRGLIERRGRVAERHAVATLGEPANQVETAVQLRRERDDAHVGRRARDLGEDVGPTELCVFPSCPSCPSCLSCPQRERAHDVASAGTQAAAHPGTRD